MVTHLLDRKQRQASYSFGKL